MLEQQRMQMEQQRMQLEEQIFVGRLGSGPRLVIDRADVVSANRVDWPCRPADRGDVVFSYALCRGL